MKIGNFIKKLARLMRISSPETISWEEISQRNQQALDIAIKAFANRPMHKTVIDLKLPPHSRCVDMAAAKDCIVALFDIPSRGVIPFIIYPDKNEVHEVQLTPENLRVQEIDLS